jgi:hypothetical protein
MSDKPQLGRGAWIGFRVDRNGYDVTVYDPDSNEVETYSAGNSPWDSQAYIPLDAKEQRVPVPTLRRYARITAQDFAAEYGINLPMIHEEEVGD